MTDRSELRRRLAQLESLGLPRGGYGVNGQGWHGPSMIEAEMIELRNRLTEIESNSGPQNRDLSFELADLTRNNHLKDR